jgi:3D (Asp-Asp-Asp) domain-containing protein
MAGPAVALLVRGAVADRAHRGVAVMPPPKRGRGPLWVGLGAAGVVLLPALLVVGVLVGSQPLGCGASAPLPGSWSGPGSLGGVAGTGVTRAELAAARRIPGLGGMRLTPGAYSPTAYFPNPNAPSTNCSSTCLGTASGILVNNATRRAYLIASNPRLNQYGALAYIWPNPYGWAGPFVVADTGSAFNVSGRLDFYIFIDHETWQQALAKAYQWGPANTVTVSATPIQAGGPSIAAPLGPVSPATPVPGGPAAAAPAPAAIGGCGAAVLDPVLSGRVSEIAARYVGDGPSIPGFQPPSTSLEWCAWFASNVWRLAGVPIAVTFASNDLYQWGALHHTLWMTAGQPPPGPTPPLGAALGYGTGPQSTATSSHVNLVTKVNADGSFMLVGGNETGRVLLTGPCRLTGPAGRVHLVGPGCDSRPVYGIAAPGGLA